MPRRHSRDMSIEEYDDWLAATKQFEAVAEAADEEGGPRLSLVPLNERGDVWPTDLLPPAATSEAGGAAADAADPGAAATDSAAAEPATATPFDGVELEDSRKRLAGWSANRQRFFLASLAETGSVHLACTTARLTARSAYRLRMRSPGFAAAWDTAEQLAAGRLSAIAFDRAINGRVEQVWHQGELVMEKRLPSDRLLMWLLTRLDPRRFGVQGEQRGGDGADPQVAAREGFAGQLDRLTDVVAG